MFVIYTYPYGGMFLVRAWSAYAYAGYDDKAWMVPGTVDPLED